MTNYTTFTLNQDGTIPTGMQLAADIWRGVLGVTILISGLFIIWKIYKEIKGKFIDILKLMQYFLLLFHFTTALVLIILSFTSKDHKVHFLKFMVTFEANIFYFILLNQAYLLIMNVFIRNYSTRRRIEPDQVVKKNRKIEIISISIISSLYIIVLIMVIFLIFTEKEGCPLLFDDKYSNQTLWTISIFIQAFLYYSRALTYSILIISMTALFFAFRKMRLKMEHYYEIYRKQFWVLYFASITFYTINLSVIMLDYLFKWDFQSLSYMRKPSQTDSMKFVSTFLLEILRKLSFFVYVFLSLKTIDFKVYLNHLKCRFSILEESNDFSVFIHRSSNPTRVIQPDTEILLFSKSTINFEGRSQTSSNYTFKEIEPLTDL